MRTLARILSISLAAGSAAARVPCAGEGPPIYAEQEGYGLPEAVVPTASATLQLTGYAGRDTSLRSGDLTAGMGFALAQARLGVCGAHDGLAYRLIYEPWNLIERARPDAMAWGRLSDALVAWLPTAPGGDWSAIAIGVGKVPFGRGREQPSGALPLATRPLVIESLAPDRRLGLSGEADLGLFRLALGLYEGARLPSIDGLGGVLAVAHAQVEPWGPVGRRSTPEYGAWTERPRSTVGASAAYLWRDGKSGYALGGELAFGWKRLFLSGEFLYADLWPLERPSETPGERARRLGGYLEASLRVVGPFSLAVRGEYLDEQRGDRFFAAAAGATWLLIGPALQLQAIYSQKFHLDSARNDGALLLAIIVAR